MSKFWLLTFCGERLELIIGILLRLHHDATILPVCHLVLKLKLLFDKLFLVYLAVFFVLVWQNFLLLLELLIKLLIVVIQTQRCRFSKFFVFLNLIEAAHFARRIVVTSRSPSFSALILDIIVLELTRTSKIKLIHCLNYLKISAL